MTKEFKVIKVTSVWSYEKLRKQVENTLNIHAQKGWEFSSIDYLANTYTAMITFCR